MLLLLGSVLLMGVSVPILQSLQDADPLTESPYLRIDPAKMVIDDRDSRVPCGECHGLEYETWRETTHAQNFDDLHRSESAQAILEAMEFDKKGAKRESLCLRCHYTATIDTRGQTKAIAGVSCESCHGAARDWLDVHNDYGDRDAETPEHRAQRVAASIAGGMLRPSDDIYAVAANCFECHTIPEEDLVNVGGHSSGSSFELVDWSEEIRHNFLAAQWSSDTNNRETTQERKRLFYVAGRALDYEYSIRGVAKATTDETYVRAMGRRVNKAYKELEQVLAAFEASTPAVEAAEFDEIVRIGKALDLGPNRADVLGGAADQISELTQAFLARHDGSLLTGVDTLLAGGKFTPARPALPTPPTPSPETPVTPTDPANPDQPATPADPATPQPAVETPTVPDEYVKRTRMPWFTDNGHQTLDPYDVDCGSCHGGAVDWLSADEHGHTVNILYTPEAAQIAQLYGITSDQILRGNQVCTTCHATVISGQESQIVENSVSCQSCHGAASGYEDPHQDGGNPQLGMTALKQANARAANCARCHHISDERLLASGHPSGQGADIAAKNANIKHWPDERRVGRKRERRGETYTELSGSALASAYASVTASRPIPRVEVVQVPTFAQQQPSGGDITPTPGPDNGTLVEPPAPVFRPPPPQRPRPVRPPRRRAAPLRLDLDPFPQVSDSTSTEDLLLIARDRLEALYKALGRGN